MTKLTPVLMFFWFCAGLFSSCAVSQVTENMSIPDTIPYFPESKYEDGAEVLYPQKSNFQKPEFIGGEDALNEYLATGHKVQSDSSKFLRFKRSDPLILCDIDEKGIVNNVHLSPEPAMWYRNYPLIQPSILKAIEVVKSMPKWKSGTYDEKPVYVTGIPLRVAVTVE